MEENCQKNIVYKKSWIKPFLLVLMSLIVIYFCLFALSIDDSPKVFIFIMLFCIIIVFLLPYINRLISPTFLCINNQGINYSGIEIEWKDIHEIIMNPVPGILLVADKIHIVYGDKKVKRLMYYFNRKKTHQKINIDGYYLRGSIWDIYETLQKYHQKYHKE